ncbi:hypothetical protein [Neisseria musculi]|uniref:hypothetical protein n=1 Tax=Neisseria musculi TaxID=1815583 RepID=UPI00164AD84D|nr:hypothetical protein [Neisseria musculi]
MLIQSHENKNNQIFMFGQNKLPIEYPIGNFREDSLLKGGKTACLKAECYGNHQGGMIQTPLRPAENPAGISRFNARVAATL